MAAVSRRPAIRAWAPRAQVGTLRRLLTAPLRGRSFGISFALSLGALVVVALLYVWTRLEVIRIGYALSEQARLHRALLQHTQRLRLELATRKDPAYVERFARERLHMTLPDPTAIRVLRRERTQERPSSRAGTGAP